MVIEAFPFPGGLLLFHGGPFLVVGEGHLIDFGDGHMAVSLLMKFSECGLSQGIQRICHSVGIEVEGIGEFDYVYFYSAFSFIKLVK